MASSQQNTLKRALATRTRPARTSRANSEDVCLDEDSISKVTPRPSPSPRQRRHTKFDLQASQDIDSDDNLSKTESTLIHADQAGEKQSRNWCFFCRIQVESKTLRLLFGLCAVINILSLVFSAPLFVCDHIPDENLTLPSLTPPGPNSSFGNFTDALQSCNNVFIQYTLIAAVDFLLAVFYTLQTLARIEYLIFLRRTRSNKVNLLLCHHMPLILNIRIILHVHIMIRLSSHTTYFTIHTSHITHTLCTHNYMYTQPSEFPEIRFGPDNSPIKDESYGSILRLVNLVIITLVLWYSVGIGVRGEMLNICNSSIVFIYSHFIV